MVLRRLLFFAAALAALATVVAVLAHTPPARRAVLRRVIATLEERFGVALSARDLRYNLPALRVTLDGAALAASSMRDEPFLTADTIEIDVPRAALFGPFSLESVRLENGRLTIVRRSGGATNLPSRGGGDGGAPAALPIGRITIPRLAIGIVDEPSRTALTLPALSVDVGPDEGSVQMIGEGVLRRDAVATTIPRLGGGVAFDGRAVNLARFALTTDEGDMAVDGSLALLVEEPAADVEFSGAADVAGLARWAGGGSAPTGRFTFDGTVNGPLSSPQAVVRIAGGTIGMTPWGLADISAQIAVDDVRVAVADIDAAFAGGRVSGAAEIPFASGEAAASVSWRDLDTSALVRALVPDAAVLPAARARGSATFRGTPGTVAAWTLEAATDLESAPTRRGRIAVSGSAVLRIDDGAWQLESSSRIAGAPARIRLRGNLDPERAANSTIGGSIALQPSNIPALVDALRATGLADLPREPPISGTLEVETVFFGTVSNPRLQITAQGRDIAAAGVRDLFADLTAVGTTREMAVDGRLRQTGSNTVIASGTVWPSEARVDLRLTGTLREPARLAFGVPIGGVINLKGEVSGPFAAPTGTGTITVDDARYDGMRIGRLEADVALDASAAAIDVTSGEFGARVTARLTRDAARLAAIDVRVDEADIARIVRDAGLPVPLSGRVTLTAGARGSLDDWRQSSANVEVTRLDARAGELPISLASAARVRYEAGTLDVTGLEAAVGESHLSVDGRLAAFADVAPVAAADALRATLVGDLTHVLAAARATGLVDVPDAAAEGPLVLLARATGSAERPVMAADLEFGPGRVALPGGGAGEALPSSVDAVQIRARVESGWVELLNASAEWQGSRIGAEGRAPLRLFAEYLPDGIGQAAIGAAGPAVLTARVRSITPRVLEPFASAETLSQIDGSIDASAQLSAATLALEDLEGEVRLDALDLRIAARPMSQRTPTRITFADGFARVAAWDWTGPGATLGVQGQVRLADRAAAILAAGRLDLQMLTPFVRDAGLSTSGTLVPLIAITGPIDSPAIDADVTLADGGFHLGDPRVVATGLTAKAVVSPLGARITAIDGSINGGTLTGEGQMAYAGPERPSARLVLDVMGMALEFPEGLRSELDAAITLSLAAADDGARGSLEGTVTVVRSAYREPIAVVTGLLDALRSERLTAATAGAPGSFSDRLALDVRVVTDSDVIVDNNLARLQLGGDLRVVGTAAAPALSGRATLREGGELFIGANQYSIESGIIDFENPLVVEPDMNVEARTRAGGEEIELTLKGTPETLDVDLTSPSNPELGQADLASLLLTGRTLDEVPGSEGQIVGEQVLSYLSGDVLSVAGRALGLDTIRFGGVEQTLRRDPAAVATETDPTSRLTFGKTVGDVLEITLSQSLRNADAQTWIVDYLALPQLAVRLVSHDNHLRSYEFRHDVSFGPATGSTAPAPRRESAAPRVISVQLEAPDGLEEALRRELRLQPGDIFDFTEWQRDRDRLEQLLHAQGRLEARVTADRREDASGVTVLYEIEAGPSTSIVINGYDVSGDAREAIERAWTRSLFDDFLEEEAAGIVRRTLAADGYLQPEVAAEITVAATKTLAITVVPGVRTAEQRIVIAASDEVLARDVDRWVRSERLTDAAWREPVALERAIVAYLQERGHLTATASAAPPEFQSRTAVVTVMVEPGPVFTIGRIEFMGAARLTPDALREAAELASGTTYAPEAIAGARARVLGRYHREGFADARVTVTQQIDPRASRLDVVFALEEGSQQVLREISVAGNRSIETQVITRALDVAVGEPLGRDAWLRARSRLFDTALFRRVDVTTVPLPGAPAAEGERPVRVEAVVQEWPALRLRYGFQVSEERPEDSVEGRDLVPGLSADLTRRTVFGKAITTGAVLEYQRRDRTARLFANAPTLFGMPIESLVTAHRSRQEFVSTTLLTDRAGVSWEQRMRVTPAFRVSYGYAFDRDHTFDTEPNLDDFAPDFDETVNVARLNAAAVFDRRDDPLDTTRGFLLSSSFDYSSDALGSDVSFVSGLGQAYYFRPWREVVFASAARLGLAAPLGGQPLIPSERFFAGGARTVRGVPEEGLGPRDFLGALGGGALLVMNQEVRVPIFGWLRGVGFVDAGNVFDTPSRIDFDQIVGSAGGGLRLATPFALLRVDYGRVFTQTGRTSGRWTFGIGQAF